MAKKKPVTKESVKAQDEIAPDAVEDTQITKGLVKAGENPLPPFKDEEQVYVSDLSFLDTEEYKEEKAAVKSVAKKKGLSSFGSILAAANAKRKERKKMYGKEN